MTAEKLQKMNFDTIIRTYRVINKKAITRVQLSIPTFEIMFRMKNRMVQMSHGKLMTNWAYITGIVKSGTSDRGSEMSENSSSPSCSSSSLDLNTRIPAFPRLCCYWRCGHNNSPFDYYFCTNRRKVDKWYSQVRRFERICPLREADACLKRECLLYNFTHLYKTTEKKSTNFFFP